MKTVPTPISELNPGDKIFVPWPADREKPDWWKLPEVLTVRAVNVSAGTVDIDESGGLNLKETEFNKITDFPEPEEGDTITFQMEWLNEMELWAYKEFTARVNSISKDPMKRHPRKCIVTIDGEDYGITFDMISKIEKAEPAEGSQLQMF